MIPVAWLLAYWLRFNLGEIPAEFLEGAVLALPLVILIQGAVNWMFGLYRGVWRFASLPDLMRITKAVLAGTTLSLFALFILNRMETVPRSVPVLYFVAQILLLAGPRLFYRWLKDHRLSLGAGQRVLIVGAGRAGEMLVRDMLRDPGHAYLPVAFVDDKLRRQGGEVHGIPVRGGTADIPELAERLAVDLLLLSIPSASAREMQRLVDLCEKAGRPFRTVPQLHSLMTGQVSINQLRPVSIEDLLGRNPVKLDWEGIRRGLVDRAILVTGGGGSIGAELCRQIAASRPGRLLVVDNSEFNLYRIDMELRDTHPGVEIESRLLDVTDVAAVRRLFQRERPQIVFHAAAYKHVPLLEHQVRAAIRNNVLGTEVVAAAADHWDCAEFVLISTDKAVNPTNIMGATKRASEILCQALDGRSATRYTTVRFGNVLGSAGSVVPLFRRQIERGGPVTVTDPDIERFFMTIPEACQLIMQAAAIGQGGEIFVLDMGDPVKIRYLAEQMIRLSGKRPGEDIVIEYVGLRPGEKLFEELFYASEDLAQTDHPKIRIARRGAAPGWQVVEGYLADLQRAVQTCDDEALRTAIRGLLPQWQTEPGEQAAGLPLAREATRG
ncbi:MAG: nucleoside-diphosphate sugar epimerase/dehydratase [Pseudomonadota bacterium]|nr:nucleoside-diphosphate sugar epimerase/dehydratase [Pseudomonadota bacterium]